MKRLVLMLSIAATVPIAVAADLARDDERVTVAVANPDGFTDANPTDVKLLTAYLRGRAGRYLAPGTQLAITIVDVDLAGYREWWRGVGVDNARIVRDLYPPRIKLEFKATDAGGAVLSEGRRNLSDPTFLWTMSEYRSDPLRYEKTMLDNWLQREFASSHQHTQ